MPKILLVEDDNNLREIFEMRLQAEGYETVTAADGEEGLAVAMKEKPDLVIADVMMPKLSGFEMLETLRASPQMSHTKVVMMTALGQAEDRARGEKLAVIKYLVKSQVTLEDFVRVVREVLQADQAGAATGAAPAAGSIADSLTTNNLEGEQAMQDDNTQQNNPPAPDSGAGGNPMSGDSGADMASNAGQLSTDEAKDEVNQQVNDFAGGAPSMPDSSSDTADASGGESSGTSVAGGDTPASSPPAEDAGQSSGGESAQEGSDNPTGPAATPGGPAQV